MRRVSIGQKIFLGFSVIIILCVAALFISYPYLITIDKSSSLVLPAEKEMNTSFKLSEAVRLLESKIELYLMVGSQASKEEVYLAQEQLGRLAKMLAHQKNLKNLSEVSKLIHEIDGATGTLLEYIDKEESAYKINQRLFTAVSYIQQFEEAQNVFQEYASAKSLDIIAQEKDTVRTLLRLFLVLGASIICLGSLVGFLLTKLIVRNISKLRKATQEIASGNLETSVSVSSGDEIGQLADSFNVMLTELRKSTVSKEYLDNIIDTMADMLIVVDSHLRIRTVNRAVYATLGYGENELRGKPITRIFSPSHALFSEAEFARIIKKNGLINYEMHYRTKNQTDIPVLFSASVIKNKKGGIDSIICTSQDISVLKRVERELRALSLTDHLTKLYNRRGFLTLGEMQIKLAKRNKQDVMLFFADVDNMKLINDTFGHCEGDSALIEVAAILKNTFREPDIIARIGGDEFVIFAVQASKHEANSIINRLKNNIDERNSKSGNNYHISLSMGIAYCEANNLVPIERLLTRADQLMYEQKTKSNHNGNGGFHLGMAK